MLPLRVLATAALLAGLTAGCTVPGYTFGSGGAGGASAGGAAGSGGSGGTVEAGPDAGCQNDQDCSGQKPLCNTSTGACVQCLPSSDLCVSGKYCALPSYTCQTGCKNDGDCNAFDGGTGTLTCDPTYHYCKGCKTDDDCPLGTICNTTTTRCNPGCTAQHGCPTPAECCSSGSGMSCIDTSGDLDNCGSCGHQCQYDPANSKPKCVGGNCGLSCSVGTTNCNSNLADGCETCGQCGTGPVCKANEACQSGQCVGADAG